ncbi:MAG: DUF4926 domain-containing protein [Phycisphaerales bacterium JB039]
MTDTARLHDTVALLRDFPGRGAARGDVGAIVEIYDDAYEVEFTDENGAPRTMFAVPRRDCLPVRLGQAAGALTGVAGSLWYWYDPAEDMLDVRLVSKRSVAAQPEPAPEGFTLMRDPATGTAVGMVVRGFWTRFGAGSDAPDRTLLERQVSGLAAQLAA